MFILVSNDHYSITIETQHKMKRAILHQCFLFFFFFLRPFTNAVLFSWKSMVPWHTMITIIALTIAKSKATYACYVVSRRELLLSKQEEN